jgi:hypothetical protein
MKIWVELTAQTIETLLQLLQINLEEALQSKTGEIVYCLYERLDLYAGLTECLFLTNRGLAVPASSIGH